MTMIRDFLYICYFVLLIPAAFVTSDQTVGLSSDQTVGLSSDQTVALSRDQNVGLPRDQNVGIVSRDQNVGVSSDQPVGLSRDQTVGLSSDQNVGLSRDQNVGLSSDQTVGLSSDQNVGLSRDQTVGVSRDQTVGLSSDQNFGLSSDQPVGISSDQNFGLSSDQPVGLANVWVSKIFSDTMWTYAPYSTVNSECTRQGKLYLQHLTNNSHWAVRMLDASLVTPSGLIAGETHQFGHPSQCVKTQIPIPNFRTKYCLPRAQFVPYRDLYPDFFNNRTRDWPPYDMDKNVWDFMRPRDHIIRFPRHVFSWGVCVPESCSAQDIQTSLNGTLSQAFADHKIQFTVNLKELECYSASETEARQIPPAGYAWTYVWCVLLVLCILGTIADYQHTDADIEKQNDGIKMKTPHEKQEVENIKKSQTSGTLKMLLLALSFRRNARSIISQNVSNNILIFDGFKGLCLVGVILFHREFATMGYAKNLEDVEELLHKPSSFTFTASTNILDTFFFVSGFLLAWSIIQNLNKDRTINFGKLILVRALRMWPMYIMLIAFSIYVQPYISEGPLWKTYADTQAEVCRQYWWQHLLFVATLYTKGNELCIPTSWYLCTEFQLHVISLALIYVVTKFPAWRKPTLITALIVSNLIPPLVIYFTQENSFWFIIIRELRYDVRSPYFRRIFSVFYVRIPPYIYGVCTAYLTDSMVKKDFKFSTIQKTAIFAITASASLAVLYGGATLFLVPERVLDYNLWEHVAFVIPYRLVYSTTLAAGIVIEHCGGYGVLSDFVCHPIFVTIGRLSFHMFLWNSFTIQWDFYTSQSLDHFNMYIFMLRFISDLGIATLISFVTTILLEPPMAVLRKKFLPR